MNNATAIKKRPINIVAVSIVFLVVILLGSWLIFKPDAAVSTIGAVQASSVKVLSPFYL